MPTGEVRLFDPSTDTSHSYGGHWAVTVASFTPPVGNDGTWTSLFFSLALPNSDGFQRLIFEIDTASYPGTLATLAAGFTFDSDAPPPWGSGFTFVGPPDQCGFGFFFPDLSYQDASGNVFDLGYAITLDPASSPRWMGGTCVDPLGFLPVDLGVPPGSSGLPVCSFPKEPVFVDWLGTDGVDDFYLLIYIDLAISPTQRFAALWTTPAGVAPVDQSGADWAGALLLSDWGEGSANLAPSAVKWDGAGAAWPYVVLTDDPRTVAGPVGFAVAQHEIPALNAPGREMPIGIDFYTVSGGVITHAASVLVDWTGLEALGVHTNTGIGYADGNIGMEGVVLSPLGAGRVAFLVSTGWNDHSGSIGSGVAVGAYDAAGPVGGWFIPPLTYGPNGVVAGPNPPSFAYGCFSPALNELVVPVGEYNLPTFGQGPYQGYMVVSFDGTSVWTMPQAPASDFPGGTQTDAAQASIRQAWPHTVPAWDAFYGVVSGFADWYRYQWVAGTYAHTLSPAVFLDPVGSDADHSWSLATPGREALFDSFFLAKATFGGSVGDRLWVDATDSRFVEDPWSHRAAGVGISCPRPWGVLAWDQRHLAAFVFDSDFHHPCFAALTPLPIPLRQRQRDDGLISTGRVSAGQNRARSLEGSLRQAAPNTYR